MVRDKWTRRNPEAPRMRNVLSETQSVLEKYPAKSTATGTSKMKRKETLFIVPERRTMAGTTMLTPSHAKVLASRFMLIVF